MSAHATITLETPSCGDPELDAIALCVQAIARVQDVEARRRIADYLHDRYDVQIEIVK